MRGWLSWRTLGSIPTSTAGAMKEAKSFRSNDDTKPPLAVDLGLVLDGGSALLAAEVWWAATGGLGGTGVTGTLAASPLSEQVANPSDAPTRVTVAGEASDVVVVGMAEVRRAPVVAASGAVGAAWMMAQVVV
jgi:hypothetical protein